MRMKLIFAISSVILFCVDSLVVKDPCCHVFEHRGAMFGPELPVESDSIFDYIPERPRISSVEGPLKLTQKENPALCRPENVAKQLYHFEDSIALIPRGGCSFAEKVYFAQLLGAKAAIIFQSKPERSSGTGNDDVIVMAEDSRYGNLVDIPSAFISYNSWMNILSLLKQKMKEKEDESSLEEIIDLSSDHNQNRVLRSSDERSQKKETKMDSLDYEKSYQMRKQNSEFNETEMGLNLEQISFIQRKLEGNQVYVVLNATGSLPSTGPDALPMMWDSMLFLIKVFLIIWSVMGFAYVSNWIKLRYKRYKRQTVIRSLPCKEYKKLQFHSSSKSKRREYEKVETEEREEEDLEQNGSGSKVVTLEEYNPLIVSRQNSDLKLRNSPKKKKEKESLNLSLEESSVETEVIECDNCVICLCEFEEEDLVTVLKCKHIYHKDCIEPWLVNKSSLCPICKQSIFSNGESRSINEINQSELEEEDGTLHNQQRRGSPAVSIAMFIVIVLSFMFIMSDDNN